jgi:hypothetical protein
MSTNRLSEGSSPAAACRRRTASPRFDGQLLTDDASLAVSRSFEIHTEQDNPSLQRRESDRNRR